MITIRTNTREVKRWFCCAVLAWRTSGLLGMRFEHAWINTGNDVGVYLGSLCEHLATCRDPVPTDLRKALGLNLDATFSEAVSVVEAALRQPVELTEEELAEDEATALLFSEIFEELNAENPDMPPLPLLYPARMRRRQ